LKRSRTARTIPRVDKSIRKKVMVGRVLLGVLVFGFWEFSSGRLINSFWVSKPSLILLRIFDLAKSGLLWFHVGATLQELGLGLVIGMAIGVVAAVALAYSGTFQHWLNPYILALSSLPKASLAPLFIIWFGIGLLSKVVMVISMVVFIVFYNIYEGIQNLDTNLTDMMKIYRAKPLLWAKWIILPSLATWIVNSLRISIGTATIGAVISEMIGASRGIGYYISYSSGILDMTGAFTGLCINMVMAVVLGQLVGVVERLAVKR